MALSFFKKDGDAPAGGFHRDERKARRFFEHAQTVADARNYDYAIECYVNGLRHDPDNMDKHEALHEVAKRRKVAGMKPAGLTERFKSGGSTALDKMLHAEKLWAKDPLNISHMRDVMRHAVEADQQLPDVHMAEVAYWFGSRLLENAQGRKPDKKLFLQVRDLFSRIQAWDKAVEACKYALRMDPNNDILLRELKELEAELTMDQGGYTKDQQAEEGGFRRFVRDAETQRDLELQDATSRSEQAADELVERRRAEHEEDPHDMDRLHKLVDALVAKGTEASEEEAIGYLKQAWEQTGQARYKTRIGDIHMRRFARQQRELKKQLDADPDNQQIKQKYDELRKKRLQFELEEYQERVKQYPTDVSLKFELAKRLYQSGQIDEAISAFQQAKSDPKHRAISHEFLGSCYVQKGWLEEAIETLRQGVEAHPNDNDRLGLEMRYLLLDALERNATQTRNAEQAQEAQRIASHILQTDINYRDIQKRVDQLRQLIQELKGNGGEG